MQQQKACDVDLRLMTSREPHSMQLQVEVTKWTEWVVLRNLGKYA